MAKFQDAGHADIACQTQQKPASETLELHETITPAKRLSPIEEPIGDLEPAFKLLRKSY